jgi:hypothetical protein
MATKHELANKKMQEMRLKNEEILKRFQVFNLFLVLLKFLQNIYFLGSGTRQTKV